MLTEDRQKLRGICQSARFGQLECGLMILDIMHLNANDPWPDAS